VSSPYELMAPSRWAQPPRQFSFSSLQAVADCPRRWQLLHSEWGTHPRFPERAHPSTVEGQIVHEALDLLFRALGRVGRPPPGSAEFQAAASGCGFWDFFATRIDEWNSGAARHPRAGPGFVIRTPPRELANRAVRLFREQYRPGDRRTTRSMPEQGVEVGSVLARLRRDGALSEVRLEHPSLPLAGILDLVTLEQDSAVTVVDFKTGAAKDSHRKQLLLYAMLWWRVTGVPPARIEVQYLNHGRKEHVSRTELEQVEKEAGREIEQAVEAIARHPAPAHVAHGCAYCPVRARCDDGWPHSERPGPLAGRTADCEITVASAPTRTGFTGRRRDGRELPVVYDSAVGATLPSLGVGTRMRLVDAVPTEEGKTLEIRAWSECYLL
jgi:hypothetical protein